MHIVTLMNQKGGVGKTTIAQCVAAVAYSKGYKVAVIDMDAQGSSHEIYSDEAEGRFDKQEFFSMRFNGAQSTLDAYRDLCKGMADMGFDYLFLDLPPQLLSREHVVATISDLTLVPMKISKIDERSTATTVQLLDEVGVRSVVVLNDVPVSKKSKAYKIFQEIKERFTKNPAIYLSPVELTHRDEYVLVGSGEYPVLDNPKTIAAKESVRLFELIKATLENLKQAEAA